MVLLCTPDSVFSCIVPPKPITLSHYRCGKSYLLDPLLPLYETAETFGLMLVSGDETRVIKVDFNHKVFQTHLVHHIKIFRDKRQKKGGQSAHRFQMNRLGQIAAYVKSITAAHATHLEGIPTVVVGAKDICSQLTFPIKHIAADKLDIKVLEPTVKTELAKYTQQRDNGIADKLINRMLRGDPLVVYGKDEIATALTANEVRELYTTADMKKEYPNATILNTEAFKKYGGVIAIRYY